MRISVRVHPGARRTGVGGRYGEGEPPVLVVRVAAPAVDGRANEAVRRAVGEAFGVGRAAVRVVAGAGGRSKVLEVAGADPGRLEQLVGLVNS